MQIINLYQKNKKNKRVFEHVQHACLEACVCVSLSIYKNK